MTTLWSDDPTAVLEPPSAVAIGVFDGLHRGHHRLLRRLSGVAAPHGLATVVVTFDPHPAEVLRPSQAPARLTDIRARLSLLADTGLVQHTYVIRFDRRQAAQDAGDFVTSTLVRRLRAHAVVVGEDFRFGARRHGDVALLRRLGEAHGFQTISVPLMPSIGRIPCSSTVIRRLIMSGDLAMARRLLGRPHEISGRAAPSVGLPQEGTVVVDDDWCLPPPGRYLGTVEDPERRRRPAWLQVDRGRRIGVRLESGAHFTVTGETSVQFLSAAVGAPVEQVRAIAT